MKRAKPTSQTPEETALELLSPAAADRSACEEDIRNVFYEILLTEMVHAGILAKLKIALRAQLRAAKRFQVTQKKTTDAIAAGEITAKDIASEKIASFDDDDVMNWMSSAEEMMLGLKPDLAAHIERLTKLVAERGTRRGLKQKAAAIAARDLLEKYGRPVRVSKDGDWCKLAAILFGRPGHPMQNHCRAVRHMDRHCRAVQPRPKL
jgi:hypothetical protein